MARVVIVVFDGVNTLDFTGPAEVFACAMRQNRGADYSVIIASAKGGAIATSAGFDVATVKLPKPRKTDRVLVAGGEAGPVATAVADAELIAWVRRAAEVTHTIGSVCSGAFVLARAGVLDGHRAATHWDACDRLAALFPKVTVDRDAIFVREGRLWTSAGVTTGIDMALAMVEEDHGVSLADAVAARLVLYARRPGFQSQFSDALVAQTTAHDPLGPAIAWARTNLRTATIEQLARKAGLSLRTFHRRCLTVLKTTPAKLLEKLRVERARALLSDNVATKTAAADCGFGTVPQMTRAFRRALGVKPSDYQLLFCRDE